MIIGLDAIGTVSLAQEVTALPIYWVEVCKNQNEWIELPKDIPFVSRCEGDDG